MKRDSSLNEQSSDKKNLLEYPKLQNLDKLRKMNTKTVKELSDDIEEKVLKLETLMEEQARYDAKTGGKLLQS